MAETTKIDVAVRWKDLPQDLQEELAKIEIEDRHAGSGFEFRGRRFFYMEFANDPDDYDPGYYTVLGLDEPLPDYLEELPISCTARIPKLATDIGSMHVYAHGMVRNDADDPLHVELQGHGDNLARLQHMASALVGAIETMP